MTLKEHIDDIREGLETGRYPDEAAVSQGIVLRILNALNWPTFNTLVVSPEYRVEGGRVDFALCHPESTPRVFVEVKQVGNIEGAEEQLFGYAFRRGIPIAILTDGQQWHFFYPIGEGNYRERKVHEMDLTADDSEKNAEKLNRYLNYELIRMGEVVEAIKQDYEEVVQQRQIATQLPKIWSELVKEKNEDLLLVIMDAAKNKIGYEPTEKQVLNFLKSLNTSIDSPTSSESPAATSLTTEGEESFTVNGIKRTVNAWQIDAMRAKYNETGMLKHSTQLLVDWGIIKISEKNGAWSFVKKITGHISQSKKNY